MKSSFFISVEGPDGSGKSTQIDNIRDYFEGRGHKVLVTREPGGTPIGEKIRSILLDKANKEMCDMAETLLYAASRAQIVNEVIKPNLAQGTVVICDRFVDSSIAYQGFGRGLGDCVWTINQFAIDGCLPDITFVMNLDPDIGKGRIDVEVQDRLESEKLDFHRKVYDGYLKLEELYSDRIVPIDATQSIDKIKHDIYECLVRTFEGKVT